LLDFVDILRMSVHQTRQVLCDWISSQTKRLCEASAGSCFSDSVSLRSALKRLEVLTWKEVARHTPGYRPRSNPGSVKRGLAQ
jgi:hypothetical protein